MKNRIITQVKKRIVNREDDEVVAPFQKPQTPRDDKMNANESVFVSNEFAQFSNKRHWDPRLTVEFYII